MKNKLLAALLICAILLTLIGCTDKTTPTSKPSSESTSGRVYKLIVNGKDITEGYNITLNKTNSTNLPYVAIMEELGAEFVWQNEETANMAFNGKEYVLNTANCTLFEVTDNYDIATLKAASFDNIIFVYPGGTRYTSGIGKEFYLDSDTISCAFGVMETGFMTLASHEEKTVTVGLRAELLGKPSGEQGYKLIVNGKDITGSYDIILNQAHAVSIPYVAMMEELGAEFVWQNEETANMIFDGREYVLNTSDCTLFEVGKSDNLFLPPDVRTCYTSGIGKKFYLDHRTITGAFGLMETGLMALVESEEKTVMVGLRAELLGKPIDEQVYKLIVNGKDITGSYHIFLNKARVVSLPYVAMMEELGAKFVWKDKETANMTFSGREYILNTADCTLFEVGKSDNLFLPLYARTNYTSGIGKEFYLDNVTINSAFELMEIDFMALVESEKKTVTVALRSELGRPSIQKTV